jgi:hypothetical protein
VEPRDGARECAAAAAALAQAITKTTNPSSLSFLAHVLTTVAARMEPGPAAEAAAALTQAITKTTDVNAFNYSTQGLTAVAARLEPGPAADTAASLAQVMTKTEDPSVLCALARCLLVAAARLEPGEGARLCAAAATTLAQAMAKTTNPDVRKQLAQGVIDALTMRPPNRQALTVVAAVAGPSDGCSLPVTLALLTLAAEPPPCRLSTQELVDLLKHPLFVGEARQAVLDQLANRYGRPFADQWEFVRFAHEHLPDVDLDSPPKRPTTPVPAVAADGMKR